MKKSELRKEYLKKRKSLDGSEFRLYNRMITEKLVEGIEFRAVHFFHHYLPIPQNNEFDPADLIAVVSGLNPGLRRVAPRVDREIGGLRHVAISPETVFETGTWGIPEPVGGTEIDAAMIDLVLVPLLCFDLRGHRVGYGGGYYDRFLSECRADCLKVGISFFEPAEVIDDIHPADIRLDFCVTPESIYSA